MQTPGAPQPEDHTAVLRPGPPLQPEPEPRTAVIPVAPRPAVSPAAAGSPGYVRSLAPLVGLSIVVVVLIAGITAWISSLQEPDKPTLATARPPAAGTFVTPSSVPTTTKAKPKATAKPKAVAPSAKATTKVAPTTTAAPTTTKAASATPATTGRPRSTVQQQDSPEEGCIPAISC